jgi:hypothetical protein
MEIYYGIKEVACRPMTLGEYNKYRGWEIPANENPEAPGYLVEYQDGGKPNHPDHNNYISWSPEHVFEASYKKNGLLSFSEALFAAKRGLKITRSGWNGSNMHAYIVRPEDQLYRPYWELKCADTTIAKWAPSGSDVLATDWYVF